MKNKNTEELARRYREAWLTSQRLESGLQLGHSSGWPQALCGTELNLEQQRRKERELLRIRPTAEDVEQMVECINWLTVLNDDERKLIWMKASGLNWRTIATRSGIPRSTIYRHWHKALLKLFLHFAGEGVDGI